MKVKIEQHVKDMRAVQKKIGPLVKKWIDKLWLNTWEVASEFQFEKDEQSLRCRAKAHVDWQYMHGTITFYLPNLLDDKDGDLEKTIVHELGHFLVNEMREYDEANSESIHHEERVVSHFTNILLDLGKKK